MSKTQTVPMQLPIPPKQWWIITQGNFGKISHAGLNRFAYDFVVAEPEKILGQHDSKGAPVLAPARGKVTEIVDTTSGSQGTNYIKIEHAAGEVGVPIHIEPGSVTKLGIKVGDIVEMGQQIATVGNVGTGSYHLHFALSNEPISTGYDTMPSEFMYYEVSTDGGKTSKFVRSGTPQEDEWVRRVSLWSPWSCLEGQIVGEPAAISPSSTTVDIYARGTDNRLWQRFWDGSNWSNWFAHEGGFLLDSSPVVYSRGQDHRDVYVRGQDGAVYQKWWDGKARKWSGWLPLGGQIIGEPAVVATSLTTVDVYARGTDNRLWQQCWDGSKWSGWFPHEDTFLLDSSPSVFSRNPDHREIYVRGKDGAVYQKWWDGKARKWSGWFFLGGQIVGKPTAISRKPNQVDVFVRGTDNRLWHRWWSGSNWSDWVAHEDGFPLGSSLAVISRAAEHVDLYVRGENGKLWQKWWQA